MAALAAVIFHNCVCLFSSKTRSASNAPGPMCKTESLKTYTFAVSMLPSALEKNDFSNHNLSGLRLKMDLRRAE